MTVSPRKAWESSRELWCLHVIGPDDVHPAPDRETAERWADEFNAFVAKLPDRLGVTPGQVPVGGIVLRGEAAPWPWSAGAHADGLAQSIADMSPPSLAAHSSDPEGAGE